MKLSLHHLLSPFVKAMTSTTCPPQQLLLIASPPSYPRIKFWAQPVKLQGQASATPLVKNKVWQASQCLTNTFLSHPAPILRAIALNFSWDVGSVKFISCIWNTAPLKFYRIWGTYILVFKTQKYFWNITIIWTIARHRLLQPLTNIFCTPAGFPTLLAPGIQR